MPPAPWPLEARDRAEGVLCAAFGVRDGFDRLHAVLSSVDVNYFGKIHHSNYSIQSAVNAVVDHLCALPATLDQAVRAFFIDLVGDVAARDWVATYRPELLALISEADHQRARPAYEARLRGEHFGLVRTALEGLPADLTLTPDLRDELEAAQSGLARLHRYKAAHDLLHEIQTQTLVLVDGLIAAPDDALAPKVAQAIEDELITMSGKALALQENGSALGLAADLSPIADDLSELTAEYQTPASGSRQETAETLRYRLRFLIRNHLPRLHGLLARTAADIPFEALDALLAQGETAVSETRAAAVGTARAALSALLPALRTTLVAHGRWQRIDRELWQLEDPAPGQPRSATDLHWRAVLRCLGEIVAADSRHVLLEIEARALQAMPPAAAGAPEGLQAFVRAARLAFQRVDKQLLDQCGQLSALRTSLAPILESQS